MSLDLDSNQSEGESQGFGLAPTRPSRPASPWAIPGTIVSEIEDRESMHQRVQVLRRYALHIVLGVVACIAIAAIFLMNTPKLYDSTAVVRVDLSAQQNLVGQIQPPTAGDSNNLMATEVDQLDNPAVVIPVINNLKLEQNPELDYRAPTGALAQNLFRVSGVPQPLLDAFMRDLTVSRPPNSYLIDITFRAKSPDLAATVANAVAQSMIDHEYLTRSAALRASSKYLTLQVQELRARMEQSVTALSQFESASEILSPDNKFNLLNQQLSTVATDLDDQLKVERKLQSELQLVKDNNMDAILVSGRGDSLKPLLDALHEEQLNMAAVQAKYGPADPTYREETRRLAGYQAAIDVAMAHIGSQVQDEAQTQETQIDLTTQAYNARKSELESYNAKVAQYTMLEQQADSQTKLYDDMLQAIQQADVAAGYHANNLRVVGEALPSPVPSYPRTKVVLIAVFLFSLLGSILIVFAATNLDRTLSDPTTVLAATGAPAVASLPLEADESKLHAFWPSSASSKPGAAFAGAQLSRGALPQSAYAEAVYGLRTAIFLGSGSPPASLAVTSAQPRDGKTTTSIGLATACARHGTRTVIVDADMRRPSVYRNLGISNRFGLTSLLNGELTLNDIIVPLSAPNMFAVPAGPAVNNSTELLASRFAAVVEDLKNRFDMVLVDCPPTLGFADSMIVGPTVDAVLVVVRAGSTPRAYVRATVEMLRRVRANVAGIVLNGVSSRMNEYYRYYNHYTEYYSRTDEESQPVGHI